MNPFVRICLAGLCGAFALLPTACKEEEPAWKSHTFDVVDLSRSEARERLPHELWEKIAANAPKPAAGGGGGHGEGGGEHGGGEHGGGGHEAAAGAESAHKADEPVNSVPAPLKIYLIEKNQGVLLHGNTQLNFGPGGGTVDLKSIVKPKNGSFYLVADFLPEDTSGLKVYFLSESKEREIEGEAWGSGCDTFYDVTTAFKKAAAKDGLLINTAAGGAASALAGTFFFVSPHAGRVALASLTVKDSAHPQVICPPHEEAHPDGEKPAQPSAEKPEHE